MFVTGELHSVRKRGILFVILWKIKKELNEVERFQNNTCGIRY